MCREEAIDYEPPDLDNWFSKFDKVFLLLASPTFYLMFTPSCFKVSWEYFLIYKLIYIIPFCKFSTISTFVTNNSLGNIMTYANI